MLTFEREITALEAAGQLDAAAAARLRAIERREIFSVYPEVRALSWGGVMLIVGGVGVLVGKNLDRIGPLALACAIALAATACYGYAAWRRRSATRSLVDDYVLLLGALLLSADLGYVESQLHLLDQGWPRHLLILAVVHGIGAYVFASRALLALSISALAAWFGIEQRTDAVVDSLFMHQTVTAIRAYACAAVVVAWRLIDGRVNPSRELEPVFDHFAANLALLGALVLTFDNTTRSAGTLLTLVVAAAVVAYGMRRGSEAFILYAYVYAVIAVDVFAVDQIRSITPALLYLVVSTVAAIVGLFVLHARYKRRPT
jgi:hypothetical protein